MPKGFYYDIEINQNQSDGTYENSGTHTDLQVEELFGYQKCIAYISIPEDPKRPIIEKTFYINPNLQTP